MISREDIDVSTTVEQVEEHVGMTPELSVITENPTTSINTTAKKTKSLRHLKSPIKFSPPQMTRRK